MHLYFYIRGTKQDVDWWLRDLQALHVPYEFIIDGTPYKGTTQLNLREWGGWWELVFPEPCLQMILSTLTNGGQHPFASYEGWKYDIGLFALRKMIGLDACPDYDGKTAGFITTKGKYPDIRVIPIGIKKDVYGKAELRNPLTGEIASIKEGEIL